MYSNHTIMSKSQKTGALLFGDGITTNILPVLLVTCVSSKLRISRFKEFTYLNRKCEQINVYHQSLSFYSF